MRKQLILNKFRPYNRNRRIVGGLVMGVNFNIGELLTLALDFGGRANVGTGTVHYNGYFRNYDKHETSWGYEGFVNFAFIFRVNDLYRYQ